MNIKKTKLALLLGATTSLLTLAPFSNAQTGTGDSRSVSESTGTMRDADGRNNTYPLEHGVNVAEEPNEVEADDDITNRDSLVDQNRRVEEENDPDESVDLSQKHAVKAAAPDDAASQQQDAAASEVEKRNESALNNTRTAFDNGWIEGALETSLQNSDQLKDAEIKVRVEQGEATLSGTVESNEQRKLAEDIARDVEGVESVQNKLKVKSADDRTAAAERSISLRQRLADLSTTAVIKRQLLTSDGLKGMQIDVDTRNDKVTLSGSVTTEDQRARAEAIAKEREGIAEVVNNLQVES